MTFNARPFIQSNTMITRCLNKVDFILIGIKLEHHPNMIKISSCQSSGYSTHLICRFEKQEISCISLLNKLFLTYIIKFPRLLKPFCTFFLNISFAVQYMMMYFICPFSTNIGACCSKLKYTIFDSLYIYIQTT